MGYHKVINYSGTDDQKINKAFTAALKEDGSTVDFTGFKGHWTKDFVYGQGDPYVSLHIVGSKNWTNVTYTGSGTPLTVWNWKDGSMKQFSMRRLASSSAPDSVGVRIVTDGSSSRNKIDECRFQGFGTGMVLDAPPGIDMCRFDIVSSEFYECQTGLKVIGSNNLGVFSQRTMGSYCKAVFDFTEGGSGSILDYCGGSYNDVFVKLNGGYNFRSNGCETEDNGVIYQIGSEQDAGQETRIQINDIEHRSVKVCVANVFKAGHLVLNVDSVTGQNVVNLTNKSGKEAFFYGSSNLNAKKIEGSWKISQAQAVEIVR